MSSRSKLFVQEAVLQQYIFEKLNSRNIAVRRRFLPDFLQKEQIKMLIAEFRDPQRLDHIRDFHLITKSGRRCNIEVEWTTSKFNHPIDLYQKKKGYIIVFYNDIEQLKGKVRKSKPSYEELQQIDIVDVSLEDFKEWFVANSYKIISKVAAAHHPDIVERSEPKYWVVYIPKGGSEKHYKEDGVPNGKWAFRFVKGLENIMDIAKGDYVIFVSNNSTDKNKGRKIFAGEPGWSFGHIDIFRVTKGYYCDWQDGCFERKDRHVPITEKEFMHFFQFDKKPKTHSAFLCPEDFPRIFGTDFSKKSQEHVEFCNALRFSNTQSGSPFPISQKSFNSLRSLLERNL